MKTKKKLTVRVIGPEVFGLTKRERMKWFKAPFCDCQCGLCIALQDSRF